MTTANPAIHAEPIASKIGFWWADRDRHGPWTALAAAGVVAAALMALFGLPPINLHGPQHFVGIMDPFCGMTRALRLLARGQVGRAITYNPASPLVAFAFVALVARAGVALIHGRWLDVTLPAKSYLRIAALILVAALWAHQQGHAALLMRTS